MNILISLKANRRKKQEIKVPLARAWSSKFSESHDDAVPIMCNNLPPTKMLLKSEWERISASWLTSAASYALNCLSLIFMALRGSEKWRQRHRRTKRVFIVFIVANLFSFYFHTICLLLLCVHLIVVSQWRKGKKVRTAMIISRKLL